MKCTNIDKYFSPGMTLPFVPTTALDRLLFGLEAESQTAFTLIVDIILFNSEGLPVRNKSLLNEEYVPFGRTFMCYGIGEMVKDNIKSLADDITNNILTANHVRIMLQDVSKQTVYSKIVTAYFSSIKEEDATKMFFAGVVTILPAVKICTYACQQFIYSTLQENETLQFEIELFKCIENEPEALIIRSEIKDFSVGKKIIETEAFSKKNPIRYIDVSPYKINKDFDVDYDYYIIRAIKNEQVIQSTQFIVENNNRFSFAYRNSFGIIDTLQAYSITRKDVVDSEILNTVLRKKKINTGYGDIYSVIAANIISLSYFKMWRELLRADHVWIFINGSYKQIIITEIDEQEFDLTGSGEKIIKFKFIYSDEQDNLIL